MSDTQTIPPAPLGWSGFATGAVALILTLVVFWAGPFGPQQAAGVSIGELAAEIAKSATRSVTGQAQPAPVALPRTIDDYLNIAVGTLAGIAIALGVAALIRHEHKRAAVSGIALGLLAVGVQLFTYTIMLLVGALVISAIVYALRDVFEGIFGG
jgi:hypothetical protein